jgi:hypothetical protein
VEQYARYRAPAESGQKLVSPSWSELPAVVAANRGWRAASDVQIAGQPLPKFAAQARAELLTRATEYIASYADGADASPPQAGEAPLIFTGHQPELVHPGVWLKNFAAAQLARGLGGIALNLIIDADACRSTSVRVPGGTVEQPYFTAVEFDRSSQLVPWEERRIVDRALWKSFPERVRQATAQLLPQRFLDAWWPSAVGRAESTGRIGAALAQARHLTELEWGPKSLELPQSQMCQTPQFRRFACSLLAELPRFADAYNGALDDYRRAHHIRNHAQPVSNLLTRRSWVQAPFWVWTSANPQRRAVYVRREQRGVTLTDRETLERRLPLDDDAQFAQAVATLGAWEAEGVKLRSRALVTTMFARIALADLFIHGIGGAKYDEATDGIIRRFFGVIPPKFAAISGTLRLPVELSTSGALTEKQIREQLRQLTYHPERLLPPDAALNAEVDGPLAEKRRWIATPKTPQNAQARHQGIAAANETLQTFATRQRSELEALLAHASEQFRARQVLQSREYAFCLFPRHLLQEFLLDFSSDAL